MMRICRQAGRVALSTLAFIGLAIAACGAEHFPVVDGDTQAVLVGNAEVVGLGYPGPRNFLQHYIEQSTGRTLPMVPEEQYDPQTMPFPIFVGRTQRALDLFGDELAEMDRDSYIVSVHPDFVILVGASDLSNQWAQFDFLREYLGIDSYFPAKLGLVVPEHDRVLVPVETRIEVPAFRSRAFSAVNSWRNLRTFGDIPWRMYRRYNFHHNLHTFIPVDEFGETHPEFFPWVNGKRVIVSSSAAPGPCISNPEFVQVVIDKARRYFDENPDALTISLGMTDGGWCECPQCQAMDGPSLEIAGDSSPKSQRYYTFLNQVARALQESHPGKLIGVLGYGGAEYPPAEIPVEPNIIPYLCYNRANWTYDSVRSADLRVVNAWLDRVDQIGIYEYLYGMGFSIPRIYNHHLADFLRYVVRRSGSPANGFYAEIYSNHGLDGPKAWVTEKLLWDPFQDVDALVRRWCRAVFAEAAEPMERYFRRLEQTRIKNAGLVGPVRGKFGLFMKDRQLLLFPPEDIEVCMKDLRDARRLARHDVVRDRIEYFASTFRITQITSQMYHAYLDAKRLAEQQAPADRLLEALIEGDRHAPEEDLAAYVAEIQAGDPTKFLGGVEIALGTEIAMRIINELCWTRVADELAGGERDPDALIAAARKGISPHLPDPEGEPALVRQRVSDLRAMASRVAACPRLDEPPTIDGTPDEPLWRWVEQSPWFAWKSARDVGVRTSFACAHDDRYLYVALRCPQDDMAERSRVEGYGVPAWKYAGVEVFVNADQPDAEDPTDAPHHQSIIALGGGLWENNPDVTTAYAATDDDTGWRAELQIDLQAVGLSPADHQWLRLNLVRNILEGGHSGQAWFPSSGAHKDLRSRGWLILEK